MPGLSALAIAAAAALSAASRDSGADVTEAYTAFRNKYRRGGMHDGADVGYEARLALFKVRLAEIEAHNARPGSSWVAGVNHLMDYTEGELQSLRGLRRSGRWWETMVRPAASFVQMRPTGRSLSDTVDWRSRLRSSWDFVHDQGRCGDCWAVATVGALEMHAELQNNVTQQLSYEQLVDCVPNPQECGGQGGCDGATAELAFQYIKEHGLAKASDYHGYQSGGDGSCRPPGAAAVTTTGYVRLPVNELVPLMEAVAFHGPVVSSVHANKWNQYKSGIFDSCDRDASVDHAVVILGYGYDKTYDKMYWLIRNSWGTRWGENGHLRLERHSSDAWEQGYCGTDHEPQKGVFCKGAPESVPVCGMCGVLSDNTYPKGVRVADVAF